jgi:hypothetical protein
MKIKEVKKFDSKINMEFESGNLTGECYVKGDKYFLVRDNDVLQVNNDSFSIKLLDVDTLALILRFDRPYGGTYSKIPREEFNTVLNNVILKLGISSDEFKVVEDTSMYGDIKVDETKGIDAYAELLKRLNIQAAELYREELVQGLMKVGGYTKQYSRFIIWINKYRELFKDDKEKLLSPSNLSEFMDAYGIRDYKVLYSTDALLVTSIEENGIIHHGFIGIPPDKIVEVLSIFREGGKNLLKFIVENMVDDIDKTIETLKVNGFQEHTDYIIRKDPAFKEYCNMNVEDRFTMLQY